MMKAEMRGVCCILVFNILVISVMLSTSTSITLEEIPDQELDDNTFKPPTESYLEDEVEDTRSCGASKRFSGYDELEGYFRTTSQTNWSWAMHFTLTLAASPPDLSPSDYSTTNIQVEGVDEPDILKTDGTYIYMILNNEVVILKAYPVEEAKVLSRIKAEHWAVSIFVRGSNLVLFERFDGTYIKIYDISSRSLPRLIQNIHLSGHYYDSRLIDDRVYIIVTQHAGHYSYSDNTTEISLPTIESNGSYKTVDASEVCYFDEPAPYYEFTMIASIDLRDMTLGYEVYLTDGAQGLYVSKKNLYIVSKDYMRFHPEFEDSDTEISVVHKISITNGEIEYIGKGEVPGEVLNQFSMDEYDGYFRIATTKGEAWRTGSDAMNNLYILDGSMEVVGKLEGLAPGERIYSARFIGDRCYLVTFKKVDPFFVIDLTEPESPTVLGELKIPGYSDYLHPYDENHIIGLGKDTIDMGDFARFQGVKLSLFDVTDVAHPAEVSQYIIGDRGTYSSASRNHKAFLFSSSKNLLILPIVLAEINESEYPEGVAPNQYGEYVWQGAYVFSLTLTHGFELRGRITHFEQDEDAEGCRFYELYFYGPDSIKEACVVRSLYIEEGIYTISERMVKINSMDDLAEIKRIEF